MSLLSDLLEAAVSGVTKPTTSSTSDSTTNPEFATVFDAALSSTDTVGIDPSLGEMPADSATHPRNLFVKDGADPVTTMETQNMTQVGNPSDIAGVSAERPAQAASPDAVTNGQATGEAFEAVKESLEETSAADLIGVPAGVSNQVAAEGSMPASTPASLAASNAVIASNTVIDSNVTASGAQGETEMAAQDVQTLSAGAPSTDEALTLSMMAAGQGARVSQPLSNRPVSTISASTASPGATPTGITPAGNALGNMTASITSVDATGSISQESFLNPESKMTDSLLITPRETTRVSQPESIAEQRPAVAAVGAATTNTAGIGGTATKQSAFIEQPLDLTQSNKQQQATEMATHVRVLKNQGGGEAKINLHPAELGRMSISVSTDATDTKVSFVVETSQARQAVEAAMPRLKELLEQSGLSLADSDVTEQHKQSADEKRTDRTPASPSLESPDAGMAESELTLSVALDPSRLLDAYA